MKSLLIAALLTLGTVLAFAGCRKASTPAPPPTAAAPAADQFQHPQGGVMPAESKFFKGSIGSALGLQMKLVRDSERLTGSYFYQKVGKKIELRGTIDPNGNVLLEEFDADGKPTGIFKGVWKTNQDGLIQIEGDWSKPGGEKKTPFSLNQEPIEFSSGVEIIAKQIKENNKKLKYEIDVEYPQLTGSSNPNFDKLNQTLRSLALKSVTGFRKDMTEQAGEENPIESETGSSLGMGYTIAVAKDDFVSVQFDIGSYYAGAAHPNSHTEVVNFDLKNGKALRLGDLFKPGSKYLQTISTAAISDLKKQSKEKGADSVLDDDWIQRGAGPDPENYKSWTITRKGLKITFDSYQVAPYAAGPQEVLLPYSSLKDIARPDGLLAQFMK